MVERKMTNAENWEQVARMLHMETGDPHAVIEKAAREIGEKMVRAGLPHDFVLDEIRELVRQFYKQLTVH